MLEQHDASSWAEVRQWLSLLEQQRATLKGNTGLHVSQFAFRGHADADWELETTLERFGELTSVERYYYAAYAAKPQIESHTGRTWDAPSPPDFSQWLSSQDSFGLFDLPGYEYLAYLRHHGFPSPLLDWSASPYVASFFAFKSPAPKAERVAIYAYFEYAGQVKGGCTSEPHIRVRGPYVRTHQRHYWQQSEYTICVQRRGGEWHYASHEAAVECRSDQECLWKITFPASERLTALRELDQYNLNAYSLFGSEDALAETVAVRELLFRSP